MVTRLLFAFLVVLLSLQVIAQSGVSGVVYLPQGEPAAFTSVAASNMQTGKLKGTNTDADGRFVLNLEAGRYALTIHLLGYHDADTTIEVVAGKRLSIQMLLRENPSELGAVQIFADRRGLAREVVSNAIDARKNHFEGSGQSMRYDAYTRTSVQCLMPDTARLEPDSSKTKVRES